MKLSDIKIYKSPKKSKALFIDPTKVKISLEEWDFVRVASEDDLAKLKSYQKTELQSKGYVIIKTLTVIIVEKENNNELK